MTREEREEAIKNIKEHCYFANLIPQAKKALGNAIKALKQEPIIDKIKAEIANINLNEVATKYEDRFYGFQQEVIKILDKYKAEGEDKE